MKKFILAAGFILTAILLKAQTRCTTLGQNPSTAFPVCGTNAFSQASVPICGGHDIPAPTCAGGGYTDKNPFWYKFTCFQTGTLEFLITPNDLNEDYDWQLFDVTGRNVNDVYTDQSLIVTYNWSGEFGLTGAAKSGRSAFVCGGKNQALFSTPPVLQAGHDYLLLVSHFSNSQSGYQLSFGGGTAVITDPTPPKLRSATTNCAATRIKLALNKKMKCSSIAPDGSDFGLTPSSAVITGATGINCSNKFETDTIELTLNGTLPDGDYQLTVNKGSDGNTLLDLCDNSLPLSEVANFRVKAAEPSPMDSIRVASCTPSGLTLYFSRKILSSSISVSDFLITGTYPVTVSGARGSDSGPGTEILVTFSSPLQKAGNFTLTLQRGTDGNTLINECNRETPEGSSLTFLVGDTVNAHFTYQKFYGCVKDTVRYFHHGADGVNSWNWILDENKTSQLQHPEALYSVFNHKLVQLAVSNGYCSDTSEQVIHLDNFIKAEFSVFEDNCPNEPVKFTGAAVGPVKQHQWAFGDGGWSNLESPSHSYGIPSRETLFNVRYTVTDSIGCQHTAIKPVKVYTSCYLAVPSAFTPNGDGKNDYFYPANAVKTENLKFIVYDRWGQVVFSSSFWKNGWDGRFKGQPVGSGVYVWLLTYTERDTRAVRQQKGTVVLIR